MEYLIVNGELCHYGIKGQKWGTRRWQNEDGTFNEAGKARYFGTSAGGNARRALAGVYGLNERVYNKLGNKTLASMNKAAKEQQLKKAVESDKRKAEKQQAKSEKNSMKDSKANKKQAKMDQIDSKLKNAKSAQEMESAMRQKAKEDIRSSQNPLSRALNDISGYNNSLAKRVVEDVSRNMVLKDTQESRSKMSAGQKFIDALAGASSNRAASNYSSKGYKNLSKEYEKYKSEGGIKKSKKNLDRDRRIARQEAAQRQKQQQREAERRYSQEQRKRQEEMDKTLRNMTYLEKSYQNAINYRSRNK